MSAFLAGNDFLGDAAAYAIIDNSDHHADPQDPLGHRRAVSICMEGVDVRVGGLRTGSELSRAQCVVCGSDLQRPRREATLCPH